MSSILQSNEPIYKLCGVCVWHMAQAISETAQAEYFVLSKRHLAMVECMKRISGYVGDEYSIRMMYSYLKSENVLGTFEGFEHVEKSWGILCEYLAQETVQELEMGQRESITQEPVSLGWYINLGFIKGFLNSNSGILRLLRGQYTFR